jgi:imidazole glycerol-phosphate synthase subunit HisH
MSGTKVAVIRTGLANIASVLAGLRRAGGDPYVTENPADVERESHVMLPGVGTFGAAMDHLRACGIVAPLQQRIRDGRPTLAICVGHQCLGLTSEESPGAEGLAIVREEIKRLPSNVRVPHFGWNLIECPAGKAGLVEGGYAYFANSFCMTSAPEGWRVSVTQHGHQFVAAMERGNVLSCQFHPELSGVWGQGMLRRWIQCEENCEC